MLRVLGPVEVVGPDGVVPLGGAKERCLLAVLAVNAGTVVAEDRLVDALWDGSPPRTATKTLQNYVLRLRRRLGATAIRTRAPGYVLDGTATDVGRAEELIAEGRRAAAAGDHEAAIAGFDEALALWRGPALVEFADRQFARAEAARLDELREAVAEDRIAAMLAHGRHHEAVAACEALVDARPLRERRWAQLMVALYRDSRQAEALAACRRLRAVLADQLGVDPGPEVQAVHAAILARDPALVGGAVRSAGACFGRERELGTLLRHLADATAGRGRLTLLAGEAGIGKTRLLTELTVEAARRGAQVLSGRTFEGAGALPFHPFTEALDAYAAHPAVDLLVHPPASSLRADELRSRLLDGVARFLVDRAAAAPVVLTVDDLHWADDGTVAMLRHIARNAAGRRLLVVGTYRPGEESDAFADALGALRSETECSVLRLVGLDRRAVEQLVAATAGAPLAADLVTAVWAETDGNPFFAREVVAHLREDGGLAAGADGRLRAVLPLAVVPEGVRQVIARRRRRLSAAANRLLDAAAGIEGPFLYEPVRAAAGLSDADALAALDDVLAAGLVAPDAAPDRYAFTHALVRGAVHHGLNPSRRLRLHRDLAAALADARAAGAPVSASEIAVQYHRAVPLPGVDAGVGPALEAAELARATGAHDQEVTFLRIADDVLPPADGRRADLRGRLAVALAWSLRFDEAVAIARGAAQAVIAEVATILATAGSNRHAWELAPAGLGAAGDDPVDWAALTLLDLDRREAADPEHPGMPLDRPGRREALQVLHESGGLAGRGDLARYAVAAVHGSRERVPAAAAADPTVAAFLVGDYAAAVPLFLRDAESAEARGQLALAVYGRAGAARCQIALGELVDGVTTLEQTRALLARLPGVTHGWQLLHHQGAEDALVMALDEGWEQRIREFGPWMARQPTEHWGSAAIDAIGARAQARKGHVGQAMALLARPVRALRLAPAWAPNYCRMACEVAETLWLLDRRDHLAVVESALRDKALPADFRFPMTDARLALGRLCALVGRTDEAARWFAEARDVLDAQRARPLRAVVDHDEALMWLRSGDAAAARPLVAAADAAFRELGMHGWSRRLARQSRRTSPISAQSTPGGSSW